MKLNRWALTELRQRSGFSKSELARQAGVRTSTVADLESGRRNASPTLARKLATALKVPLPAILADPPPCDDEP